MPVHHGRHEMPGWRGYLPESVDRAARARSGRRDRGLLGTPSRRVAAFGALAVCAVAGGAVITTRPAGPPDAFPGPSDEATSVSAGSSAWTREATAVLAAIETELERTDEVRQQWDTSSVAHRDGPPPRAVLALLGRQKELAEHRDALRSAMGVIRSESASEVAMAAAWQQLRAAQEMLRALDAGRSALGDPVEATVLRLALEKDASVASAGGPRPDRDTRGLPARGFEDTATVALAATTSTLRDPSIGATTSVAGVPSASGVAREPTAPTASPTAASDAVVRSVPSDEGAADAATGTAGPDSPGLAASSDQGEAVDDGNQRTPTEDAPTQDLPTQDTPTQDTPTPEGSSSLDPTPAAPSEQTMLTFDDRSSTAAPDEESTGDEKPLVPDPAPRPTRRRGRRRPRHRNEHADAIPPTIPADGIDDEPGRDSRNHEEHHECPGFARVCACGLRSRPSERRQPRLRDVPQGVEPGGDGRLVL